MTINSEGHGEDPAISALLSPEYATMPDAQVVDINLALQQIIRGQASLLSRLDDMEANTTEEISRLKERFAKYDKAAEEWETDKAKFLEGVSSKAQKLRVKGDKLDKLQARAAQIDKQASQAAVAARSQRKLEIKRLLATQPRVKITDPGTAVMIRDQGGIHPRLEAEVVHVGGETYIFPPGQEVEVPLLVADAYKERKRLKQQAAERKAVAALNPDGTMGAQHEQLRIAEAFKKLDEKYHTNTMNFPVKIL